MCSALAEFVLGMRPDAPDAGVEELVSRASLSRLLAQLYRRELTPEIVDRLSREGVFEHLERHGFEFGAERLADPACLQELRIEYTRLFVGPGPHLSPYGSVHHPDDPRRGQLWGQTTKEVRRIALDHGLSFAGPAYDGIPDHIGHLFELLARLIGAEAEARLEGDAERAERLVNSERLLVERYLLPWVPNFCQKVRESARSSFYAEVARLTDEFLEGERRALSSEAAPSE